jgi:hypothetical protein
MINTAQTEFPADMRRAAECPTMGTLDSMAADALDSIKHYVRTQPEQAALWALGIGFLLGWKLKPW